MRSGKTVRLVMEASEKEITILVRSRERAQQLEDLAKQLGVTIPNPVVIKPEVKGFTFAGAIVDDKYSWRHNA